MCNPRILDCGDVTPLSFVFFFLCASDNWQTIGNDQKQKQKKAALHRRTPNLDGSCRNLESFMPLSGSWDDEK
jgi:hypothetical protein